MFLSERKYNKLDIKRATCEDAHLIHQLAHRIYFSTYTGILSQSQMEFMLQKSYTIVALQESMQTDQEFFLVSEVEDPIGFISLKNKEEQILRIEKLYLLSEVHGKGIGRCLINFAENQAMVRQKSVLELNVNRGNKAYNFYLKMGFEVVELVDIPYYGFILDDYVMQKKIIK